MGRILQTNVPRRETGVPIHNQQTVVESEDGNIYVVSSSHTNYRADGQPAFYVDETMIFRANANGQITDYSEVDVITPRDHLEGIRLALNGYHQHTTYRRL